ncbi:MAG: cytochrome B [Saprospiraceae bacterium]|nr:cytochrome B [Saprospiraceae bacterium]
MLNGLIHAHSGLRWIVLALVIIAILQCVPAWNKGKAWTESKRKLVMYAMIFMHIQVVIGLILYFMSPKVQFGEGFMQNAQLRFFAVEHIVLMLLAAVFVTIGYVRAKRKPTDIERFKSIFWFYLIGLLVLIAGIPWPFRGLGAAWF